MTTEPRIYVACLASYNNGRLHGVWLDCDGKDSEELREDIATMLRASPYPNVTVADPETGESVPSAEEWAIHDHEGFAGLLGEYSSLDDVAALAAVMADSDEDKRRGLLWLHKDRGYSLADALDKCEDVRTSDESPEDYAESFVNDCYSEKELGPLAAYIDFERYARDLLLGGDIDECDLDGERFLVTNASEF